MISVNFVKQDFTRMVRYRSVPSAQPFVWAAVFYAAFLMCVLAAITSLWVVLYVGNPEAVFSFVASMGASLIMWIICYIKRRNTFCPLCKGTPLLNSGGLVHTKATRIPPMSHGATAVSSVLFCQKFRCMYCGEDYDLLKRKAPKHQH